MSYGLIDSASIMSAVGALASYSDGAEWEEWTKRSIVDVTRELVLHRFMQIAPGPSRAQLSAPYSELYKCYDIACDQLGNIEDTDVRKHTTTEIHRTALDTYKTWVLANIENAKDAIAQTKQEPGYQQWVQWAVENAFVDHSNRLNGLFNLEMLEELSLILGITKDDLRTLWEKSKNREQLKLWSRGKCLDTDFEAARDAYIASAILRGRYHDELANRMDWWRMHHPIRYNILPPIPEANAYCASQALDCLVMIIITAAMEERKSRDKIGCWVENTICSKDAFLHGGMRDILASDEIGSKAIDVAIKKAKELKIRVYPKSLPKYFELAIVGTTGVLSQVMGAVMIHQPWLSFLAGSLGTAASAYGAVKGSLGLKITEAFELSDGHLRQLADSKPGRIVWVWGRMTKQTSIFAKAIQKRFPRSPRIE
jgi:hypothetical protein